MIDVRSNVLSCLETVAAACSACGRSAGSVTIVAASKTQPAERVREAFEAGILSFGENYVQELVEKKDLLDVPGLQWHFIGHLQSNKVKYIAPFVSCVHSVDSASLASEISKQALRHDRVIDVLLQVNTSGEASKSGIQPSQMRELASMIRDLPGVHLRGLMTIPAPSDAAHDTRREFALLRSLRDMVRDELSMPSFTELSMGMSDDYEIAIAEGATMIRPGSVIFGQRHYPA